MKKKINFRLAFIAAIAIVCTLVLSLSVFYEFYKGEVFANLKEYAQLMNDKVLVEHLIDHTYEPELDGVRLTIVNADGSVRYDSRVLAAELDNHSDRPEIASAFDGGEGKSVRTSNTVMKNAFYFALRMEDGAIIRTAKESDSVWSLFQRVFPLILLVTALIYAICLAVSHFLVKQLVSPIEKMAQDIEHCGEIATYRELQPFVNTIRKQHEDILKNATMRQEFTANVSHELKTPLTSISGYSELIENRMANEEDIVRFGAEIHRNAKRLLTLINDIIRLSELDATEMNPASERECIMTDGDIPVNANNNEQNLDKEGYEEVKLYELARNCVNMLQINAEQQHITLKLEGYPCDIYANRGMIEEVLYNLCDNAIRYNNEGGMVVVSVYRDHVKYQGNVILEVKDNGIGIPEEHQKRIFERFYRVDKSRSKSTGGTGLGLAIVKHILAVHGARLELHSEVGRGTDIKVVF